MTDREIDDSIVDAISGMTALSNAMLHAIAVEWIKS